jgi:predicted HTH transcriptional regulator
MLIAMVPHYAGTIERWSTGTKRGFAHSKKHGLPEPKFHESSKGFLFISLRSIYKKTQFGKPGLNENKVSSIMNVKTEGK